MRVWYCDHCQGIISTGESKPIGCNAGCNSPDDIRYVSVPHVGHAGGPARWCPKALREYLCKQQGYVPDKHTSAGVATINAISALIGVLDLHRPLGSDGKHSSRHTPTCGCDDK